ncbi:MAG: hypothetical protein KDE27_07435, partial [Planctomycetes bacterium]|nr:hypothetical protein [Planctomycetota bacterium]
DGIGPDIDAQDVTSSLFANWDPFVDPEGSPVLYEWSIGTAAGLADVLGWTRVGGATRASTSTSEVDLPLDRRVFVNVRGYDVAGNRSGISSSDGIVLGVPRAPMEYGAPAPDGNTPPTAVIGDSHRIAVERSGTTWTFREPVVAGRFVGGDWWVVGPVEIVGITPRCRSEAGRTLHGSMLNPKPAARQGYDSAMFGPDAGAGFDPELNVGSGISAERPLRVEPGSSLVSAISSPNAGALPQLEACAVLTVLAEPPPADAFRPPYCGDDKTCRWRAGALDLSRLARLEPEEGAPDARDLAARFARPWLDHVPGWHGRYLHPREHMPDYGRDIADLVGTAALVLNLRIPDEQKRDLAIGLVQLGIDSYGIVQAGGRFVADGGSGAGRKFPVVFAGAVLQDDALLRCAAESRFAFAEDAQTFYVASTAPGVVNGGHGGYDERDIGLAEWGQCHRDAPQYDRKPWSADAYRRCCTANAWNGFVLAARILGLQAAWGHDALFDYVDRYMRIEPHGEWTRSWSPFAERMWDRNRARY